MENKSIQKSELREWALKRASLQDMASFIDLDKIDDAPYIEFAPPSGSKVEQLIAELLKNSLHS